jgi:hypothetical protein
MIAARLALRRPINQEDGSVEHMCIEMAKALNAVNILTPFLSLSLAGNTAHPGVKHGQLKHLPTWVPDLSESQELDVYQLNELERTFSAWGNRVLSGQLIYRSMYELEL